MEGRGYGLVYSVISSGFVAGFPEAECCTACSLTSTFTMNTNLLSSQRSQRSKSVSGFWGNPIVVSPNNFKHKSLSCFSCNPAVGCSHGCAFCYVPAVSTNKLSPIRVHRLDDQMMRWPLYRFLLPPHSMNPACWDLQPWQVVISQQLVRIAWLER